MVLGSQLRICTRLSGALILLCLLAGPVQAGGPTFISPVGGQTLDYEGGWIFNLNPVFAANGYEWVLTQELLEVLRLETTLPDLGIFPGSPEHALFLPGSLEVSARGLFADGSATPFTTIVLNLRALGPQFLTPTDGQSIPFENAYFFDLAPVPMASGYTWAFVQNGLIIHGDTTLTDALTIIPNDPAHALFSPGLLSITAFAEFPNGVFSEGTAIDITLEPIGLEDSADLRGSDVVDRVVTPALLGTNIAPTYVLYQTPTSNRIAAGVPVRVSLLQGPNMGLASPTCTTALGPTTPATRCVSDESGVILIDYQPDTENVGTDLILVHADLDDDGQIGPSEDSEVFELVWTEKISYAALGDSFSSGEGVEPFRPGTETREGNGCRQSELGYSSLIAPLDWPAPIRQVANAGFFGVEWGFYACSGAVSRNLRLTPFGQAQKEPPPLIPGGLTQLDGVESALLNSDVNMLTLSIGGNDAGFADVITQCAGLGVLCADPEYQPVGDVPFSEVVLANIASIQDDVLSTFLEVKQVVPNDTAIFAFGYPRLFPEVPDCIDLALFGSAEAALFNEGADLINDVIAQAAAEAGVHFIDMRNRFDGGHPCTPGISSNSYLNWGIALARGQPITHSFHPTQRGQAVYALALAQKISIAADNGPTYASGLPVNPDPMPVPFKRLPRRGAGPELGGLDISVLPASNCGSGSAGAVGDTVNVRGAGFAATTTVAVDVIDGNYDTIVSLGAFTADAFGQFVGSFAIPPGVNSGAAAALAARGVNGLGVERFLIGSIEVTVGTALCAINDNATLAPGVATVVDLVANDIAGGSAIDPATLTLAPGLSTDATLAIGTIGELTITPDAAFVGSLLVQYSVCDTAGNCSTASLTGDVDPGCTINGTEGDDRLTGTTGPDIICARGGNDDIDALEGDDIVYAGAGRDVVDAGPGNDMVYGDEGEDVIDAGDGDGTDTLFGGAGADRLVLDPLDTDGDLDPADEVLHVFVDTDEDGIFDYLDNCTLVDNPSQRDSDSDGFGNQCDPDLDNNGTINFEDLALMKLVFFSDNADADLDGDGTVNFSDLQLMKNLFFQAPGPAGSLPTS